MSNTKHSRPSPRKSERGNQRLITTIVVLGAIFVTLIVASFIFRNPNQPEAGTNRTPEDGAPANVAPSTPTQTIVTPPGQGPTLVAGTVTGVKENAFDIQAVVNETGTPTTRILTVRLTNDAVIKRLGPIPITNPFDRTNSAERPSTIMTIDDLAVGSVVNIWINDSIGSNQVITASSVDVTYTPTSR